MTASDTRRPPVDFAPCPAHAQAARAHLAAELAGLDRWLAERTPAALAAWERAIGDAEAWAVATAASCPDCHRTDTRRTPPAATLELAARTLEHAATCRAAAEPDPSGDNPAELERLRLVADRLDRLAVDLLGELPPGEVD